MHLNDDLSKLKELVFNQLGSGVGIFRVREYEWLSFSILFV